MVTSQPHRTGAAQAWWAHTGSTNRGFVTLDPERQREVDTGPVRRAPPAPKPAVGVPFAFEVSRAGDKRRPTSRGKSAAKAPSPENEPPAGPADAGAPPQARGRRR